MSKMAPKRKPRDTRSGSNEPRPKHKSFKSRSNRSESETSSSRSFKKTRSSRSSSSEGSRDFDKKPGGKKSPIRSQRSDKPRSSTSQAPRRPSDKNFKFKRSSKSIERKRSRYEDRQDDDRRNDDRSFEDRKIERVEIKREAKPEVEQEKVQAISFKSLNLSSEVLEALAAMNFESATPVQAKAIPILKTGDDLIAQASTGTGKTMAFSIPCVEGIDSNDKRVQALIMCPTRELAVQVSNEIQKLTENQNIYVTAVYGGQEIRVQLRALKRGSQIIVGTPGRIKDHMKRGSLKLSNVKYLVLDEADQMLDMGFADELQEIIGRTPKDRQTVMFSATMSDKLKSLAQNYQQKPQQLNLVSKKVVQNKHIKQICYKIKPAVKERFLEQILEEYKFFSGIIFCNTKRKVDELTKTLSKKKFLVDCIHGDIKQRVRDRVMQKFKNGKIELLIATDVASRGIDVSDLEAVINYDLPKYDEDYVHRIGRTGRAGKSGYAFNLVCKNDVRTMERIARKYKFDLEYA